MRIVPLLGPILISVSAVFAGDIREFDIKTIERLGNELTRISQTRDKGATTPESKRAVRAAKAALQGKLFKIGYDYVVLDDPGGSGFLVYALGLAPKPGDTVLGGHFRVTVSPDGKRVERVDGLSRSLLIEDAKHPGLPKGTHFVGSYMNQIVSNKPVETLIYVSNLAQKPIVVGTPDGGVWMVQNGKMAIDRSKPGSDSVAGAARQGLNKIPK